ncbi:hypothetical protein QR680_008448 [Steinernema hermaphroditum]|uniref:Amine oxidase n=1 Tax=Steinernema hermaphroditum TaxID=289476 RepID=A0AA39M712_9BILA|nr:hypothetical protein QR680_008448 [Steinernema hermaphroditum]
MVASFLSLTALFLIVNSISCEMDIKELKVDNLKSTTQQLNQTTRGGSGPCTFENGTIIEECVGSTTPSTTPAKASLPLSAISSPIETSKLLPSAREVEAIGCGKDFVHPIALTLIMNSVFLLVAAVAFASAQIQTLSRTEELGAIPEYDVAIVGAGLAGLSAARRIRQSAPNAKIVILEARSRVGGRLYPVPITGNDQGRLITGDLGTLWISPKHTELLTLAAELNVSVSKQLMCGERTVFIADDDLSSSGKAKRSHEWDMIPGAGMYVEELLKNDSLVELLDSQSVEEYLAERNPPLYMKDTINRFLQTFYDTPARNISMLQLMMTVNSEGSSIEELLYDMGHGGSLRFTNKGSNLLKALAQDVDIMFEDAVSEIDIIDPNSSDSTKVLVSTIKGESYLAEAVIVAVPPTLVSDIDFSPNLNDDRSTLYKNYSPKGNAFYFTATFESPSWREFNKSGQMIYADNTVQGPILWASTYDVTSGECSADSVTGQLYGIAHFDDRSPPLTSQERRVQYEQILRRSFENTTLNILDVRDHQWSSDEFSQGSVGVLGCNMAAYLSGLTNEPHQMRIFFASAELSNHSMGMMNGAVISGQRVADEVVSILKASRDTPLLTKVPEFSPVTASTSTSPLFTVVTAQNPIFNSTPFNYQTSTVHPPPQQVSTAFQYHTSTPYPTGTFEKIDEMNKEKEQFQQTWNAQQNLPPRLFEAPGIGQGATPVQADQLISQLESQVQYIPADDRLKTIARLNNLIKSLLDQMVVPN